MSRPHWTAANMPDQSGRRAIITGGNSGVGFYTALELARHGADVILTSRDQAKGNAAKQRILDQVPAAKVQVATLDLASLVSVRDFAASQSGLPLDLLINNAGVLGAAKRKETTDGFELHFGTNVLGHFALTALLLPSLTAASPTAPPPRVVTLSSIAHKRSKLNFEDLQSREGYKPMAAYSQSKLADLIFAFELDRRLRKSDSRILSLAAHPGVANTNIFQAGEYSAFELKMRRASAVVIGALLNNQQEGALPTLYAATAPQAETGRYYGPQGFQEMRGGDVGLAEVAPQARDEAAAARLWNVCEELTGQTLL